jgi:hypothetical protein
MPTHRWLISIPQTKGGGKIEKKRIFGYWIGSDDRIRVLHGIV